MAFALSSCTGEFGYSDSVKPASLKADVNEISIGAAECDTLVAIESTSTWTVTSPCDWIAAREQSSKLSLSVSANTAVAQRSAELTLVGSGSSVKIRVLQAGLTPTVRVSADTLDLKPQACTEGVTVTSNVPWTAYTPASWIEPLVSGNTLSLNLSANPGDSRRSSYVLIQSGEVTISRVFVSQQSTVPPVPEFYKISIPDVQWDSSYVFYATKNGLDTLALFTKEWLGEEEGQASCLYAITGGKPDFDLRTKAAGDVVWIRKDGSAFYTSNPASRFDAVEDAVLKPLTLVSDVKSHGAVKVGNQIWLAEDYKTTKMADGTPVTTYKSGDTFWTSGDKAIALNSVSGVDHYLYTGACINVIAPEGWAVPTSGQYIDELLNFVGTYAVLSGDSLFGATLNYKATASSGKVKLSALGYTNTWSSTTYSTTKTYMVGMKPAGGNVNSAQALTGCFSIRLKKIL